MPKNYKELTQLNIKNTKNPIKKMGRGPEQAFFQRRYTDGQQAHGKMFNITNHQGNENQNHNGQYQKDRK